MKVAVIRTTVTLTFVDMSSRVTRPHCQQMRLMTTKPV